VLCAACFKPPRTSGIAPGLTSHRSPICGLRSAASAGISGLRCICTCAPWVICHGICHLRWWAPTAHSPQPTAAGQATPTATATADNNRLEARAHVPMGSGSGYWISTDHGVTAHVVALVVAFAPLPLPPPAQHGDPGQNVPLNGVGGWLFVVCCLLSRARQCHLLADLGAIAHTTSSTIGLLSVFTLFPQCPVRFGSTYWV
jgi:hypothetical protein